MGTAQSIQEGLRGPIKWLVVAGLLASGIALCGSRAEAKTVGFFQIEAGIMEREVVEEDPSLVGFKLRGDAVSTRLTAKAGVTVEDVVTIYGIGGGADLSIDEFDGYDVDYDGDFSGLFGGGIRVNLYRSPYPERASLFVEGEALRFTTDDQTEIEMECTTANDCPANDNSFPLRLADEEIEWNEYTIKIGGRAEYPEFSPYGGVRFSFVDGEDRISAGPDANFTTRYKVSPDLEEDDNFGIFFGVDLFLDRTGKTAINFEVSLIDQDSFLAAIKREF